MNNLGMRILVIDDEASILKMLALRLSRMGLQVETALTREEAIKKLNMNGHDLVLTDIIMPDISGHDVLNHVRFECKHSTPVIAMSGTPWLLEQSNFDAVLLKPCLNEDLLSVINRFLKKGR